MRLRVGDLVARDHRVEGVEPHRGDDVLGHGADRHGHEGGADAPCPHGLEQLACAGLPRHPFAREQAAHLLGQPVHDAVGGQVDAVPLENLGGRPKAAADELERVLVRPAAAERLDELGLGPDPVRFAVDEGAVHVPEDGGGKRLVHGRQVYVQRLLWT
ncbi:hypothetical protein GCM10025877_33160 [Agromyces mangrovi Wang et al. 2018]|nr:hypothetical protein GCM10025877_33160 [Agromyces mangrovi]